MKKISAMFLGHFHLQSLIAGSVEIWKGLGDLVTQDNVGYTDGRYIVHNDLRGFGGQSIQKTASILFDVCNSRDGSM